MKVVVIEKRKGFLGMFFAEALWHPKDRRTVKTNIRERRLPGMSPAGAFFAYSPVPRIDMG